LAGFKDAFSSRLRKVRDAASSNYDRTPFEIPRRDSPLRSPIEPPPPPPPPPAPFPPSALSGLRPAKDDALSWPALEAGNYGAVVRALLLSTLTPNQSNNLGCAYAALALEDRSEYWARAAAAFTKSRDEAQLSTQRARAVHNLKVIAPLQ
jgi:hypothetical protein